MSNENLAPITGAFAAPDATLAFGATTVGPTGTLVGGPPASGAMATAMGAAITCPVCGSGSPAFETYCVECGFLLASTPGAPSDAPAEGSEVTLEDAGSGRTYRLRPGANSVGREGCDLLLMDPTVSRRHAQIELTDGAIVVTDLGSTNGTRVDGAPIVASTPTPLGPGGSVRFGSVTLSVAGAAAGGVALPPPSIPASASTALEAPSGPAIATLQPTDGGPGHNLAAGLNTIGRRAANAIVLAGDPYISGAHATIEAGISGSGDDDACVLTLTDLGSTNGTRVNDSPVTANSPIRVYGGDTVTFGRTSFALMIEAQSPDEDGTDLVRAVEDPS